MIAAGMPVPSVKLKLVNAGGIVDADTAVVFGTGKSVLFTLPGAFTPTCHASHLPGYIDLADQIRAKGIDRIVCATVNDHFVVQAWAEATKAVGKVEFLADGRGEFAKALDAERDVANMGTRFIRAAFVIDNGIVRAVFTEDKPGQVTSSGAPAILAAVSQ